jgi:hypothetical protein
MRQIDECADPNDVVRLQFEIEKTYDSLVSLTGKSQTFLEQAILDQYPAWFRQNLGTSPDSPKD